MKPASNPADKLLQSFRQNQIQFTRLMKRQAAHAKVLEHETFKLCSPYLSNMPTRLQVRSFPLGCKIKIDGELMPFRTPHTFNNLPPGQHVVELVYEDVNGKRSLRKTVQLVPNQRVVCKLHFKKPKTLATIG
ncbi:MAG: hypothetical protein DRP85_05415 [Candidatus Makaraimicrobium thalassicum]|nr:MAG: hypothetical protein DRP85_05415 [Candidatus Omnitrophota bacterium]